MKSTSQRPRAMSHRIAKYGAGAAGALAAGFAAAPQVQAAIDYYDPADLTVDYDGGGIIYFDLDDSGGGTLASTSFFAGEDFRLSFRYYSTEWPYIDNSFPFGNGAVQIWESYARRQAFGATIGPAQTFDDSPRSLELYDNGPWQGGGEGYLGLRLGAGPNYNYGWARVNYNDADNQLTLLDFAIERTADTAIAAGAGAIPEPSHGLMALAAGAAGLVAWRRRKRS